ncbi:MAG: hypothetical protein UX26_C0027G0005 [Parcubacteria group bacterium GW2011_GWC1_45_9]|nr:MAG: hypothetical protein UX26_C0027G0005 [Parcubacteria group bacterium GW2011_GWC1_45_9]HCI05357.1 hypothetical protein [Patescibacteria group bacterium]
MGKINFKWVLLLIYLGLVASFVINWGEFDVAIQKLFYLIAPLTSIVAGILTLNLLGWQGKRSSVLKWVLAALGLWLLGELTTLYLTWKGESPYPSLADLFFLTGYVVFIKSVLLEAKLFDLQWKKLSPFLLTMIAAVFILVTAILGYIAVGAYSPEESLLVNLTTISWSIGDLIMGGMGLMLLAMAWQYRKGLVKKAWQLFMFATLINLVADTIYNLNPEAIYDGSTLTTVLDSMWVAAYFLMAGYFLEIRHEVQKLQLKAKKDNGV